MTATDVLRRLLDERGAEWSDGSDESVLHTTWNNMNCWFNEFPDGWTAWGMAMRGTPEQAIVATLGTGTCHVASSIIDTYEYNRWEYELSCGHTIIWEDSEPPNYCPNCGCRIVEPTTNDVDAEVEQ